MADAAVEAAPGDENDDSWLYGESTGDQIVDKQAEETEKEQTQTDAADGGTVSSHNLFYRCVIRMI